MDTNFESMSIAQLVAFYNERSAKPVKTFRDKPTALARVQALPNGKLEATTDSPGFRRMSTKLGPDDQESLRLKVLADQAAATAAVARPGKGPQRPAGAETAPPATLAAPQAPNPAPAPRKGAGKAGGNRALFKGSDVIEFVDMNTVRYRGDWLESLKKLKDGMTVQQFLDKGGRRRIVRRLLRRNMIKLHPGS